MFFKNKLIIILIIVILAIAGALLIVRLQPEKPLKTAEKYTLEGKEHLLNQEYPEAKASYEKAIELDPNNPVNYYQLGNVLVKLGDYDMAKEYFDKTLGLNPIPLIENASYLGLGGTYFFTREYGKAIDLIQKSLSGDLTCPEKEDCQLKEEVIESTAYPLLGSSFYFLGDFKASEEYFQKALEIELTNKTVELVMKAKTYNALGFLHLLLGNYEQSLEYFNESIATDEFIASMDMPISQVRYLPYFGRGMVQHALKDYEGAKGSLEKSLELHHFYPQLPKYAFYEAQIYNKLGKNALDIGNFNEAENYFEEVLKMKEKGLFDTDFQAAYTQVDTYDGLGEIALNFENYTEALSYFENGLDEIPDEPFSLFQEQVDFGFMKILFHYRKAFTYSQMANLLEAEREILKSVQLVESLSLKVYFVVEKIPWFKDGKSLFQKVYSLQDELEG